jgi:hypothetical protein
MTVEEDLTLQSLGLQFDRTLHIDLVRFAHPFRTDRRCASGVLIDHSRADQALQRQDYAQRMNAIPWSKVAYFCRSKDSRFQVGCFRF